MNHLTPQLDELPEDGTLLAESARDFFGATSSATAPAHGPKGYSQEQWRRMVELGWTGWSAPSEAGGSGLSQASGVMLHEEVGAAGSPEPLIEAAVLAVGVLRRSPLAPYREDFLEIVVSGAVLPCLVWDSSVERCSDASLGVVATSPSAGRVELNGAVSFASLPDADCFLVLAQAASGAAIYRVDRGTSGLHIQSLPRVDGRHWGKLSFSRLTLDESAIVIPEGAAIATLEIVLDEARVALSAELLGAAAHVLQMTQDYLRIRHQFGRALSTNQALQHKAVDIAVHVELMRSVVQRAAAVFDDPGSSLDARAAAASQAKARTAASALAVIHECIQLHGGIAYTEECSIGYYLKRAMVQAAWLGDAGLHRTRRAKRSIGAENHAAAASQRPDWLRDMREWIESNLPQENRFPAKRQSWREAHAWHMRLYEQGCVAPAWPKEFGGMGLGAYEEVLLHDLYEEFGLNTFQNMGVNMVGPLLQKYGTPDQQKKYLPDVLSGTTYWCQGYSEPEAGSDLASLRTQAVIDGDHFIVNGQKIWTSLAHEADMIFLLARTDPAAKKQQGISFLLVDMKSPGISISPIINLTGAKDFCSVFFDNVRVPKVNLVGEINQGWTMAKAVLGSERIMIGHPRFAKSALRVLQGLVRSHGTADDQRILEALEAEVADIESLYVRYLNVLRQGKSLGAETSVLKICSSECWQRVVAALRELSSLQGTVDEQQSLGADLSVHLPFQYLHAIPSTIYGGTNEIQRNILATQMLEL